MDVCNYVHSYDELLNPNKKNRNACGMQLHRHGATQARGHIGTWQHRHGATQAHGDTGTGPHRHMATKA